jgi:hypothetical protein
VSANTEEDILLSQTSYLGESQASLDSGQKHRVIAPTDPCFLVRCVQESFNFRSSEVIDQTTGGRRLIAVVQYSLNFYCRNAIREQPRL